MSPMYIYTNREDKQNNYFNKQSILNMWHSKAQCEPFE